jgi:hypothetical protein
MAPRNLRGTVEKAVQLKFTVDATVKEKVEAMARAAHASNSYFITKLVEHATADFDGGTIPQWWIDAQKSDDELDGMEGGPSGSA